MDPTMSSQESLIRNDNGSADAMEGRPVAGQSANQPATSNSERLQQDTTLIDHSSASRPRTIRSKIAQTFRPMLLKGTVKAASATSKLPLLAKIISRPTAEGLEYAPLSPGDMSPTRNIPVPTLNPFAPSERGIGFKKTVLRCLPILKKLLEEAVEFSKLPQPAGIYFGLLASHLEERAIRLQIWAFIDIEIPDSQFGDSHPSDLMNYLTTQLEDIMSTVESMRTEMKLLVSLASQDHVGMAKNKTEIPDSWAWQEAIEEIREERRSRGLGGRQDYTNIEINATGTPQTSFSKIINWLRAIKSDVKTLVTLVEAVNIHQAVVYHNGPLAGRQQEILRIRREVEAEMRQEEHQTETGQGEPSFKRPTRTSTSSRSKEDDDGYNP